MRINAYLARAGVASRRKADEFVKAGRVMVDGNQAELNTEVDESSKVYLDGKLLSGQKMRYILLNKPAGYVTTLSDPQGRRTVSDLVGIPERVAPVGRLDYDTTGALVLTNDGKLAHMLMHPRYKIDKVYQATVSGEITADILNKLSNGIMLEDGMTAPAEAKKINESTIELTIHEGKKHQVKRMLAAVGLKVDKLHRNTYAGLSLENVKAGSWRDLTDEEINRLKMVQ